MKLAVYLFLQEQYILCHNVLADFVDSFETYANFKDVIWCIYIFCTIWWIHLLYINFKIKYCLPESFILYFWL